MKKILLALAVAATFASAPTLAQERARLLGVSTLAHREGDIDVVPVSCRNRLSAVKLRSANGPAEIERVWLTYANGERDQVRVNESLRRGEQTGWIDVSGGRRCVVSVAVQGDSERRGERGRRGDRDRYSDHRYDDDYNMASARFDDRYDDGYRDDRRGRRGTRPVNIEIYGRTGW